MKNLSDKEAIDRILKIIAGDDELIRVFAKTTGIPKPVFSRWIDKVQVPEPLPTKVFVSCRFISGASPKEEFYAVHTTQDQAERQVDKLTAKFGPTFIITEAPLNP